MMDWWSLAASALWILGLAVGLAAASFAYWAATPRQETGLESPSSRYVRAALDGAGVLFGIGWGLGAGETWERLIWLVLAGMLAIQLWWDMRSREA
jgi:hypothetical protein